eukprot:g49544.t1
MGNEQSAHPVRDDGKVVGGKLHVLPLASAHEYSVTGEWVHDSEYETCGRCGLPFTTLRRRHHCRLCGMLRCSKCSNRREVILSLGNSPVRICTVQCPWRAPLSLETLLRLEPRPHPPRIWQIGTDYLLGEAVPDSSPSLQRKLDKIEKETLIAVNALKQQIGVWLLAPDNTENTARAMECSRDLQKVFNKSTKLLNNDCRVLPLAKLLSRERAAQFNSSYQAMFQAIELNQIENVPDLCKELCNWAVLGNVLPVARVPQRLVRALRFIFSASARLGSKAQRNPQSALQGVALSSLPLEELKEWMETMPKEKEQEQIAIAREILCHERKYRIRVVCAKQSDEYEEWDQGREHEVMRQRANKRRQIFQEIVSSEKRYVDGLSVVVEVYMKPLQKKRILSAAVVKDIFSVVENLYLFHSDFHATLKATALEYSDQAEISKLFERMYPFLKMYSDYINNYDKACRLIAEKTETNKKFRQFLELPVSVEETKQWERLPDDPSLSEFTPRREYKRFGTLQDLLITPIQRPPRYALLLDELYRSTDEAHVDKEGLKRALSLIQLATQRLNEAKRKSETQFNEAKRKSETQDAFIRVREELVGGGPANLMQPHRVFVWDETVTNGLYDLSVASSAALSSLSSPVLTPRTPNTLNLATPNSLKPSAPAKGRTGKLFLFSDVLMVTFESSGFPLGVSNARYAYHCLLPIQRCRFGPVSSLLPLLSSLNENEPAAQPGSVEEQGEEGNDAGKKKTLKVQNRKRSLFAARRKDKEAEATDAHSKGAEQDTESGTRLLTTGKETGENRERWQDLRIKLEMLKAIKGLPVAKSLYIDLALPVAHTPSADRAASFNFPLNEATSTNSHIPPSSSTNSKAGSPSSSPEKGKTGGKSGKLASSGQNAADGLDKEKKEREEKKEKERKATEKEKERKEKEQKKKEEKERKEKEKEEKKMEKEKEKQRKEKEKEKEEKKKEKEKAKAAKDKDKQKEKEKKAKLKSEKEKAKEREKLEKEKAKEKERLEKEKEKERGEKEKEREKEREKAKLERQERKEKRDQERVLKEKQKEEADKEPEVSRVGRPSLLANFSFPRGSRDRAAAPAAGPQPPTGTSSPPDSPSKVISRTSSPSLSLFVPSLSSVPSSATRLFSSEATPATEAISGTFVVTLDSEARLHEWLGKLTELQADLARNLESREMLLRENQLTGTTGPCVVM